MQDDWIRETIEKYAYLSNKEWDLFLKLAKTIILKPKEIFFQSGEIAQKAGFLKSGILRAYEENEKGDISTSYFYYIPDHEVITLQTSFSQNIPSKHTVEAITECEILYFDKTDLQFLFNAHHNFEKLGHKVAEKHYLDGSKRISSLQTKTAKQRYQEFLTECPALVLQVPQNMIASYLGITQFTLSKIKNEM